VKILIVGPTHSPLAVAVRTAIEQGAELVLADDAAQALAVLRANSAVDVIFCDLGADIQGLIRGLAAERMHIPVVACGVNVQPHDVAAAILAGAKEFLPLPPDTALVAAILQGLAGERHSLVVRDPAMLATVRRAEQVARTDATVLLTGASGTGKEVMARHVHRQSRRARGPFVAVNCAAIPENLLESELFGHEKGAFSGAVARRLGKFELANDGTLLLDEITEIDLRLQAKLLRALQEREIDRVGGTHPVRVNVRVLATSNRDLQAEVTQGRFREDLFFRLHVVNIRLPSLAERPADILPIAEHFARRFAELNDVPVRMLAEATARKLQTLPWRGNVRELENAIHRAVLLATGDRIEPDDIETTDQAGLPRPAAAVQAPGLVGRRIEDVEREMILRTLEHTLGNRTHAAMILGISIRALRNKLRDYAAAGCAVPPPTVGVAA
jgi:DNA-binding NtrC family response regulator